MGNTLKLKPSQHNPDSSVKYLVEHYCQEYELSNKIKHLIITFHGEWFLEKKTILFKFLLVEIF